MSFEYGVFVDLFEKKQKRFYRTTLPENGKVIGVRLPGYDEAESELENYIKNNPPLVVLSVNRGHNQVFDAYNLWVIMPEVGRPLDAYYIWGIISSGIDTRYRFTTNKIPNLIYEFVAKDGRGIDLPFSKYLPVLNEISEILERKGVNCSINVNV